MQKTYTYIFLIILITVVLPKEVFGKYPPNYKERKSQILKFGSRSDCAPATSEIDMQINNVRARLLGGGDVWWDLSTGQYVVPKIDPLSGLPEVSSIFAGAVWLGGFDPVGNLKLAAQTFRDATSNDFWPGPLDQFTGTVSRDTCAVWDRHFSVLGDDIRSFLNDYNQSLETGVPLTVDEIPEDVLGWPARGNPFFADVHDFELPTTSQGLGGFWDANQDFIYNPLDGDYPIIEVRNCPLPQFPDEMIFWIYNDAGGIHTQTQGNAIQMEVQVQAFAYATNDEINDMTFQRYKLINRATQSIDSTYFAMWVDPDLGCNQDDYIGCDTARSLAIVYNEDQVDGVNGCDCEGVDTYCEDVPILGVDYFRGPLDENGVEIGMSSFTYYNNVGVGQYPNAVTDPDVAQEYYNYMSGSWKNGQPFTFGDDAFTAGNAPIDYAFTERPDDPNGWSMCTANLPFGDRRTIQASGPFRLDPGAVNELIIGVVWVPDLTTYPCPNIDPLIFADETAQALFDNCFDITDGPDAPDMDFIELDKEIVAVLSNGPESNNFNLNYSEIDLRAPTDLTDEERSYRFEGYQVYQLNGPEVTTSEIGDTEKARLVFQTDLKNGISQLVNWRAFAHPTEVGRLLYEPEIQVVGQDDGLRHSFRITEDQFADEDRTLINHRKYYFTVVAYAFNEFDPFDTQDFTGQRSPYLEGRRNVQIYTPVPRPIAFEELNSIYGDGAAVERLDGSGVGDNFLRMDSITESAILDGSFDGVIGYREGSGPINVLVYNPLEIVEGQYILRFVDGDATDDVLDIDTRWELYPVDDPSNVIFSERSIADLNEQLINEFGFSVNIGQTGDIGDMIDESNGAIGGSLQFADIDNPWLSFIPDATAGFDFVVTSRGEADEPFDPTGTFSTSFNNFFPFQITQFGFDPNRPFISPAWIDLTNGMQIVRARGNIDFMNNVDIVFTNDKSKWSRCVIIETSTPHYFNPGNQGGLDIETIGGSENFDLRNSPSVGKEDADGDGKPDPDGDGIGMGWFPGYAVDVETGERLNVFFGENSSYNELAMGSDEAAIGDDMMWNPDDRLTIETDLPTIELLHAAGQHHIYVTNQPYDSCMEMRDRLDPGSIFTRKYNALADITWTAVPLTNGTLLSYADGLIPSEARMQLRVSSPYDVSVGTNENNGHPAYRITLENKEAVDLIMDNQSSLLNAVNVVPNPYLAYSAYEISQFTTTVKITNLPPKCLVDIYTLDGKFIRRYERDEAQISNSDRPNAGTPSSQINPAIEWDLRNSRGIPISSGLYLIHINGFDLGERTIKWFGVNRKFDPSGL